MPLFPPKYRQVLLAIPDLDVIVDLPEVLDVAHSATHIDIEKASGFDRRVLSIDDLSVPCADVDGVWQPLAEYASLHHLPVNLYLVSHAAGMGLSIGLLGSANATGGTASSTFAGSSPGRSTLSNGVMYYFGGRLKVGTVPASTTEPGKTTLDFRFISTEISDVMQVVQPVSFGAMGQGLTSV
jgi:hypothetical protein